MLRRLHLSFASKPISRVVTALCALILALPLSTLAAPTATAPSAAPATPTNHWESEIIAFETADQKQMPPPNAVLFVGSSSIRKWQSVNTDFPSVPTINRGFGGSYLSDSVYFVPRIVWPYNPRAIILYAGDNDLATGRSPERVFSDFQEFVRVTREKVSTAPIAFVSIKPSPSRAKLMPLCQKTNTLIASWILAQPKSAHLTYINVWTAMTTPQNQTRPELFGPDMLHMNRKGYDIWTKILTPFVTSAK